MSTAGRLGTATPPGTAAGPRAAGGLRQLARRAAARSAAPQEERCELCARPVPPDHRHLLQPATGAISCACRPCALLFGHGQGGGPGAAGGTGGPGGGYLALPETRQRLDGCELDDALWARLGLPVKLAFFTRSAQPATGGRGGAITAAYPSPHGALRATVAPEDWHEVEKCHPAVPAMAPEVEALLVNRAHGAREHWLVPLDDCYRLVAVVRAHWKGLGGGPEVRQGIDDFFRHLSALTTEEASWASPWESPT